MILFNASAADSFFALHYFSLLFSSYTTPTVFTSLVVVGFHTALDYYSLLLTHHSSLYLLQVAYKEAITKQAEVDYIHKKQTGGSGQFARVKIRFEPEDKG